MTPLGRSIADRPRPSEPAFVPEPPRVHLSRARVGCAILLVVVSSWLVAALIIRAGCLMVGRCGL